MSLPFSTAFLNFSRVSSFSNKVAAMNSSFRASAAECPSLSAFNSAETVSASSRTRASSAPNVSRAVVACESESVDSVANVCAADRAESRAATAAASVASSFDIWARDASACRALSSVASNFCSLSFAFNASRSAVISVSFTATACVTAAWTTETISPFCASAAAHAVDSSRSVNSTARSRSLI